MPTDSCFSLSTSLSCLLQSLSPHPAEERVRLCHCHCDCFNWRDEEIFKRGLKAKNVSISVGYCPNMHCVMLADSYHKPNSFLKFFFNACLIFKKFWFPEYFGLQNSR